MQTALLNWQDFEPGQLTGRNRRLLHEWRELDGAVGRRDELEYLVVRRNHQGLPTEYLITYHLRSICGVEQVERLNEPGVANRPLFAQTFRMGIRIPEGYPAVDAPAEFRFLTHSPEGKDIPHPWHPNIRYFGEFAGRVCLNAPDTYAGLAWCVTRIVSYLTYERYHAIQEPPYPEDFKVAEWVIRQGEPNDWIYFNQQTTIK